MAKRIVRQSQQPALKYALKGASKDKARPILYQTVNVKEDYFASADGFAAHFVEGKMEDDDGYMDEGVYVVDKQLLAEKIEGTYPDLCSLVPTSEPIFSITVNPALLKDALPDVTGNGAILEFFGETSPFLVRGDLKDDTKVMALVMPMHRNSDYEGFDPCGVISKRQPGHLRSNFCGESWKYGVNDSHEYWEIEGIAFRPEAKFVVQRNFGEDIWQAYTLKGESANTLTNYEKDDDGNPVAENHEFRDVDLHDLRAVMAAVVRYGNERRYI